MKVEKTTTGLIIHEPSNDIKSKCLQYFSLQNPIREYFIYSGNDPDRKPIFGKEKDVLYVTSGFLKIRDRVIENMARHVEEIKPRVGKSIHLDMDREPRSDLQRDCIKKMTESNSPKLTIELKPGTGKTFISLYAISKLGLKPLIVAPTTLLKNQWIENFTDMGIPKDDIATNIYDGPNKTYCVVTISSIENALRDDWSGLLKAIDKSEFGIKVTDESHLHMKGLLKLDAICNIKHNWYLSATLGRSDASEDRILNRALADAERFVGNSTYKEYQEQFVEIYLQDIYYYPSAKMCGKYFKYGKKGLIRSTYYNMLMAYWDGRPFIQNIINVIKRMKQIMNSDKKVIVLVPIITIIDALLEAMDHDQYFKKYTCAKVNGTMPLSQRREALESDIIVSTSMSMGTGVDVSDLVCVINFDQYASPIITEQICGRLRQRGWKCFYVDVCDHVKYAKTIETWGTKRRMLLPYFPGVYPDMKMLPKIKC